MAKEQWGVKVEEALFDLLEQIKFEKRFGSRDELLEFLANQYKKQSELQINEQLDLSQYDEIEDEAKKSIKDGFELIITTLKQYNKKTKFQASKLEEEKTSLDEARNVLTNQIKDIQLSHNEEIKKLNIEHNTNLKLKNDEIVELKNIINLEKVKKETIRKSLESLGKEMENLRSIAENTQVVIKENKDLKISIEELKKTHYSNLEKFDKEKQELKNSNNEEIKSIRSDMKELQDKYLIVLSDKTEILSINKFNEREIDFLKKQLETQREEHFKEIKKIENDNMNEVIKLKEFEKENIVLKTKLDMKK
jgi:hypothetical protein